MRNNLILIFLCSIFFTANSQEFIDSKSFSSKTVKGIVVIEFWVDWNKGNEVEFIGGLKDCKAYRICISKNPDIKNEYNITSVPTVVILDNGLEKYRFNSDIMMRLAATKKEVQSSINNIILEKFK
tara:strand:- start:1022 stop:1399 length:378 start_codon:yes stop_codon:yes gene_type:complete